MPEHQPTRTVRAVNSLVQVIGLTFKQEEHSNKKIEFMTITHTILVRVNSRYVWQHDDT